MPFRKIQEAPDDSAAGACADPEHDPPTGICLKPGVYEYSCPTCSAKRIIRIPRITLGSP